MCSTSNSQVSPNWSPAHYPVGKRDRRTAKRQQLTYRTAVIEHAKIPYFGVIRNESAGGFMIECDCPVSVGDEVVIVKCDGLRWVVDVVWTDGLRFGISCKYALRPVTASYKSRPVRVPTSFEARVWTRGAWAEVGVANISQKGALAYGIEFLEKGEALTMDIGGKIYTNVLVRWRNGGASGLQFHSPLGVAEISNLIISQRNKSIRRELQSKLHGITVEDDRILRVSR